MKKILIVLFSVLLYNTGNAQQMYDTLIVPKKLVVVNPGLSDTLDRAGEQLQLASKHYFTGLGLTVAAGCVVGLGVALAAPPVAFVGGAVAVVGFVNTVMAWDKIDKAGRLMRRRR